MNKNDLLSSSPVRYFEKTGAQLNPGEIGLITAKKGLGKTSVLVQFGIDTLLNDKGLIHVSFDQQSSNVIAWYTSILSEICKKSTSVIDEINEDISRNRTILNFNQETFTLPKVVSTLKALKDGGIKIDNIIVDDLNIGKIDIADLKCFCDFIKASNLTAWFSYTTEETEIKNILPKDKIDLFDSISKLVTEQKNVSLEILKKGEGKVPLNSKTLLMSK